MSKLDTSKPPPSVHMSQKEWEQLEEWQREGCWNEHNAWADRYPLVKFYPGTGDEVWLPVAYFSEFPRGPKGDCAFCSGDPCNQRSAPDSHIARFYEKSPRARTCPVCDGRPT